MSKERKSKSERYIKIFEVQVVESALRGDFYEIDFEYEQYSHDQYTLFNEFDLVVYPWVEATDVYLLMVEKTNLKNREITRLFLTTGEGNANPEVFSRLLTLLDRYYDQKKNQEKKYDYKASVSKQLPAKWYLFYLNQLMYQLVKLNQRVDLERWEVAPELHRDFKNRLLGILQQHTNTVFTELKPIKDIKDKFKMISEE